jgi:hypothetical protein
MMRPLTSSIALIAAARASSTFSDSTPMSTFSRCVVIAALFTSFSYRLIDSVDSATWLS